MNLDKNGSNFNQAEEIYNKLQAEGKNNFQGILTWLKSAELLTDEFTEVMAKNLMKNQEKGDIDVLKFKEVHKVVGLISEDHKKQIEELKKINILETNKNGPRSKPSKPYESSPLDEFQKKITKEMD